MEGKWEWHSAEQLEDTNTYYENILQIESVCPRITDPYHRPVLLLIGMNDSHRYVWWAIVNDDCMMMYTGSNRFNRFNGRGDDDLEPAADDAELCLRRLGFRQNR